MRPTALGVSWPRTVIVMRAATYWSFWPLVIYGQYAHVLAPPGKHLLELHLEFKVVQEEEAGKECGIPSAGLVFSQFLEDCFP